MRKLPSHCILSDIRESASLSLSCYICEESLTVWPKIMWYSISWLTNVSGLYHLVGPIMHSLLSYHCNNPSIICNRIATYLRLGIWASISNVTSLGWEMSAFFWFGTSNQQIEILYSECIVAYLHTQTVHM